MYRSGALHGTHSRKTAQKLPKGDKDKQTEGIKAIIQATRLEGSLFPQSNEKTEGDKIILITEELLRKGMTLGVDSQNIARDSEGRWEWKWKPGVLGHCRNWQGKSLWQKCFVR